MVRCILAVELNDTEENVMSEIFTTDAESPLVEDAKVLPQGLVPFPKEILEHLGAGDGSYLTLVCEGDRVVVMNSAVYAMKKFQKGMAGMAESAGIVSEEDADALVKRFRSGTER